MKFFSVTVIVFIIFSSPCPAVAFQWSSAVLQNGSRVEVCEGDTANITWAFRLADGERVRTYRIRRKFLYKRADSNSERRLADTDSGILVLADPRFTFGPGYSIHIKGATVDDSAYYTLTLKVVKSGQPEAQFRVNRVLLFVKASPTIVGGALQSKLMPNAVKVKGIVKPGWHVRLSCGTLSRLGHPAVAVVWKIPSGESLPSTTFKNGTAYLVVPDPLEPGPYTCQIYPRSLALACGTRESVSSLWSNSTVIVDRMEAWAILLEARSQELKTGNEMLKDRVSRAERKIKCLQTGVNPTNCLEVRECDPVSGVHVLNISGRHVSVYCDQDTDGGGWTVIQRRQNGEVDFYRGWDDYVKGFGNPKSEYWLGLEDVYQLTNAGRYSLRVDLTAFDGSTAYAYYQSFLLATRRKYHLLVSGYNGTAGDGLKVHNKHPFTTYDRDNDDFDKGNCASLYHGAWWYNACHNSHLNGRYLPTEQVTGEGITWSEWKLRTLKKVEMKIRPAV